VPFEAMTGLINGFVGLEDVGAAAFDGGVAGTVGADGDVLDS
jgi:hypothetical protein